MESLRVLYEDNHVIAVYKPAGILVQGDKSGATSLMDEVKKYLKEKYQKSGNVFLGLVHRLDRNVAGIVIFGKTSKGASRLSEQVRDHTIEKIYHAWVEGEVSPQKGTLVNFIQKDESNNKVRISDSEQSGFDRAELSYEVVQTNPTDNTTLVKIFLKTGRHHQIRAQFSHLGHPIVGDIKYGSKTSFSDHHIELYATELSFTTATGEERKAISIDIDNIRIK